MHVPRKAKLDAEELEYMRKKRKAWKGGLWESGSISEALVVVIPR